MAARVIGVLAWLALFVLTGCRNSHFETPQMQGPAAMVDAGGQPRLWLLAKQEEQRSISVGGGGTRNSTDWRTDTFFHFSVEAIDPVTTRTLWKQRIATFGDPKAAGTTPSRVIGSDVSARLLGQDGDLVWLLVGDEPYALDAADGHIRADGAGIEAANPALKGLLPSEGRLYGFDRGLVFMAADARAFVVRGPKQEAIAYEAPTPPAPEVKRKANGMPEIEPMRPPLGEVPARQAQLGGAWLGLYSPKEEQDVLDDSWGRALRYPYTVQDEGRTARRRFLRATFSKEQRFEESYTRVATLVPVPDAPVFLKGRFLKQTGTDDALLFDKPASVLVWYSTRMDDAGRLALARVDDSLHVLWRAELPFSETDAIRQLATWQLPGRVVAIGELRTQDDSGVQHREPYLASISLADGAVSSRNLVAEK
jgi:hypothetical protein